MKIPNLSGEFGEAGELEKSLPAGNQSKRHFYTRQEITAQT